MNFIEFSIKENKAASALVNITKNIIEILNFRYINVAMGIFIVFQELRNKAMISVMTDIH